MNNSSSSSTGQDEDEANDKINSNCKVNNPYQGYSPADIHQQSNQMSSDRKRSRRTLMDDSVDDILGMSKDFIVN